MLCIHHELSTKLKTELSSELSWSIWAPIHEVNLICLKTKLPFNELCADSTRQNLANELYHKKVERTTWTGWQNKPNNIVSHKSHLPSYLLVIEALYLLSNQSLVTDWLLAIWSGFWLLGHRMLSLLIPVFRRILRVSLNFWDSQSNILKSFQYYMQIEIWRSHLRTADQLFKRFLLKKNKPLQKVSV